MIMVASGSGTLLVYIPRRSSMMGSHLLCSYQTGALFMGQTKTYLGPDLEGASQGEEQQSRCILTLSRLHLSMLDHDLMPRAAWRHAFSVQMPYELQVLQVR